MDAWCEDPRFVGYLVVTNLALIGLALAGLIWFLVGVAALGAIDVIGGHRLRPAQVTQPS